MSPGRKSCGWREEGDSRPEKILDSRNSMDVSVIHTTARGVATARQSVFEEVDWAAGGR
jgi:hypothetical protein